MCVTGKDHIPVFPQLIKPQALGVAILELVTFSSAKIDLCSYFKVQSSSLYNAQLK